MSYSFFSQGEDGTINLQVRDASSNKSCDFNNNGIDVVLNRGEVNEITTTYKGLGIYKTVGDLFVEATTGDVIINTDPSGSLQVTDITTVNSISGVIDSDITISAKGTGDVVLTTSGVERFRLGNYVEFSLPPRYDASLSLISPNQLVTKYYADSLVMSGPTGSTGPQGIAGTNGVDGATGPQGSVGPQGTAGTNGVDGATGPQGLVGPQGTAGTDGATGPQGIAGGSLGLADTLAVNNSAGAYNIAMNGNSINAVNTIQGQNNQDLNIAAIGTGDVLIKTAGSTQLQINETGLAKFTGNVDLSSNQLLNCSQITATGDLVLNPVGSISANGKTLDMTGGQIHKCDLIHSQNNTDITIGALGTGNLVVQTNSVERIRVANYTTFSSPPRYDASINLISNDQLVTKYYADSLVMSGPTGSTGPQGSVGPQGIAGTDGATGPQGSVGPQGTAGGSLGLADTLAVNNSAGAYNIAMNGNSVNAVQNIQGSNNVDLNIIAVGTGDIVFKTNTSTTQFVINDTTGIAVLSNQISLARVMEKTTAGTVTTNAMSLDYTAINGVITCTPSSANNIALTLTNVPTTAGSYNLTFLIDTSTNRQYINSFNINGSAYTPISSGGFSNLTVDASATSCLQYLSVIMAGGTVSKVITNLVSLY